MPVHVLDRGNYFPDNVLPVVGWICRSKVNGQCTKTVHHLPSASVYIIHQGGHGEIAQWPGVLAEPSWRREFESQYSWNKLGVLCTFAIPAPKEGRSMKIPRACCIPVQPKKPKSQVQGETLPQKNSQRLTEEDTQHRHLCPVLPSKIHIPPHTHTDLHTHR